MQRQLRRRPCGQPSELVEALTAGAARGFEQGQQRGQVGRLPLEFALECGASRAAAGGREDGVQGAVENGEVQGRQGHAAAGNIGIEIEIELEPARRRTPKQTPEALAGAGVTAAPVVGHQQQRLQVAGGGVDLRTERGGGAAGMRQREFTAQVGFRQLGREVGELERIGIHIG